MGTWNENVKGKGVILVEHTNKLKDIKIMHYSVIKYFKI